MVAWCGPHLKVRDFCVAEPPPPPPLPAIATPKEPVLLPPDPEPTFNEQWFDDPIEVSSPMTSANMIYNHVN